MHPLILYRFHIPIYFRQNHRNSRYVIGHPEGNLELHLPRWLQCWKRGYFGPGKKNRLAYYFIQLSPSNFPYWKIFSSLEIKAFKCALQLRIREWLQCFAIFNVQQFETENRLDYFLITRNKINRVGIILPRMIPILLYHSK